MPAISAATQELVLSKATRIRAVRLLARSLDPTGAAQLLREAAQVYRDQRSAYDVLYQHLIRSGLGFVRETRPRAFAEYRRAITEAGSIGVYPWGAEQAVVCAAAAVLFEDEVEAIGSRVRSTLLGPIAIVFGPEDTWVAAAATQAPKNWGSATRV